MINEGNMILKTSINYNVKAKEKKGQYTNKRMLAYIDKTWITNNNK